MKKHGSILRNIVKTKAKNEEDAAAMLGVSRATIFNYYKLDVLPADFIQKTLEVFDLHEDTFPENAPAQIDLFRQVLEQSEWKGETKAKVNRMVEIFEAYQKRPMHELRKEFEELAKSITESRT